MSELIPRKVERAISIGLIGAAAFVGLKVGESGGINHDAISLKPNVTTTSAEPNKRAVKPEQTITMRPKPVTTTTAGAIKKSDMQPPLTPTGGDYNTAEAAASDVSNGNSDVAGAETLLAKITNPTIKTAAEHAVQVGIAEVAALDVSNGNSDVQAAESLLAKITLPDIRAKAEKAIDQGIAELAAYDVSNGNTDVAAAKSLETKLTNPKLVSQVDQAISQEQSGNSDGANGTWDALYNQSNNGWDVLYRQSASEWDALYRHTDEYRQLYDRAK